MEPMPILSSSDTEQAMLQYKYELKAFPNSGIFIDFNELTNKEKDFFVRLAGAHNWEKGKQVIHYKKEVWERFKEEIVHPIK